MPEIWLMVGARLAIALFLLAAVLFQRMRDEMHYAVVILTVGLIALAIQSNQNKSRKLRDQAVVDLVIFLLVVPAMVLTGFVGAQTGELMPAERTALIETFIAALISLSILVVICYRLFRDDRAMLAAGLLPGSITVVSLTFVLHEYRNQTVLAMIAVSYFIAAVSVALGGLIEEPVRRYIPAMFYALTVFVGVLLFDPGLGNLGEREAIIQLLFWGLIGLGLIALIVLPSPQFQPARMFAQVPGGTNGPRRRVRRNDDSSGAAEGRG